MKFVFVVPPLTGHINPTLSVGKKLLEAGHHVSWITVRSFNVPKGGNLVLLKDELETRQEEVDTILKNAEKCSTITTALVSVQFVYTDILIPLAKLMMEGVVRELSFLQPDVVIHDEHAFAGALAAYKLNIPYLTFRTIPANTLDVVFPGVASWVSCQVKLLQRWCGVDGEQEIIVSNELVMIFSSREFTGSNDFPEHYKFVGPIVEDSSDDVSEDWLKSLECDYTKKILVTMGTIERADKLPFFAKVAEALEGEPIKVIVVADPGLLSEWPSNFIVKPLVPQLALLPLVDAVICHGGHNTVCESLAFGKPLIVLPMAFDQFHVASQVVQSGAGVRLKFRRLEANQIKASMREIFDNPQYQLSANKIALSFQEAGGASMAVAYIEEFTMNAISNPQ